RVDLLCPVDTHDVGAHVGEQHPGERARSDAGQLDDLHTRKRSCHASLRSDGAVKAAGYRPLPLPLISSRCYYIALPDAMSPVASKPPPAAIVKTFNAILPRVAGTPFGKLFPAWMAVLGYEGR